MTAHARFKQSDITKALKAAKAAGFDSPVIRIAVDGKIEILTGRAANDAPKPTEFD